MGLTVATTEVSTTDGRLNTFIGHFEEQFAVRYADYAPFAVYGYDAMQLAIQAVNQAVNAEGLPVNRKLVASVLREIQQGNRIATTLSCTTVGACSSARIKSRTCDQRTMDAAGRVSCVNAWGAIMFGFIRNRLAYRLIVSLTLTFTFVLFVLSLFIVATLRSQRSTPRANGWFHKPAHSPPGCRLMSLHNASRFTRCSTSP